MPTERTYDVNRFDNENNLDELFEKVSISYHEYLDALRLYRECFEHQLRGNTNEI